MRRAAGLLVLLLALPAHADYQVSGTFLYKDREFDINGFTGSEPNRPIRFADVEVVDGSTVLTSGATDANGTFTLQVTDSQTRNLTVRVRTASAQTPGLFLTVRQTPPSGAIFAVAHPVFTNHAPDANIDFTGSPVVAVQTAGGDAFNIFDVCVDGLDFVALNEGARPGTGQSLTVYWAQNSLNGTYYDIFSRTIFLLGASSDSDAYDDAVILHEFGHYVEFELADSDNPAGSHGPNDCLGCTLAWSEGYATFLQNMVRDWLGLARPDIYVDTTGQPGTGHWILKYTVEPPTYTVLGSGNEIAVNATLWDVYDQTTTADATPGVDDETMSITDGRTRFWDVFTNYLPQVFVSTISIEDFWDGWFVRGQGHATVMEQVFGAHGLEFYDDAFESDDSVAQAREGGVGDGTTEHTIYPGGDSDWTRFSGVQGGSYIFETRNLLCGSDTEMLLYAANGTTVLASNDDRSAGDLSSRIAWTATVNGPLYLRVRRSSKAGQDCIYGSHDLFVDITVAIEVSDIQIAATAAGVRLTWRGAADAAFSHFDVERAQAIDGPWERRNLDPIAGNTTDFEFFDAEVMAGAHYSYRLVGVDLDGTRTFYGPYAVVAAAPARVMLYPPQPNPFNPRTAVRFDLPESGRVSLRVFDLRGRLVRTLLAASHLDAGTRLLTWDGRDDTGADTASGVYWLSLDSAQGRQTQRAVLLR
jgi:hypothetical protein